MSEDDGALDYYERHDAEYVDVYTETDRTAGGWKAGSVVGVIAVVMITSMLPFEYNIRTMDRCTHGCTKR